MPSVEQELMRVARAPAGGSPARVRVGGIGRPRFSGAMLALAVSVVAMLIGAGFLVALHGSRASGGSPPAPAPKASRGLFRGAPHGQHPDVGRQGYLCRRAPRNRYLPRDSGCVTVRRAAVVGGDRTDLIVEYAHLGRRVAGGYLWGHFTLELIRPSGQSTRLPLQYTDVPPTIDRIGNVNGVPGDELTLLLDDISSGDTYGIVTDHAGRLELVHPLFSGGGDGVFREGFACRLGSHPRVISRSMVLLYDQPTYGRWRWTVTTYAWRGATLRRSARRTYVRRGMPGRSAMTRGTGCGRAVGSGTH